MGMKKKALESPELINLLRMYDVFPKSCIQNLFRGQKIHRNSLNVSIIIISSIYNTCEL